MGMLNECGTRSKQMTILLLSSVACMLVAGVLQAAVIDYDEAVDGDLGPINWLSIPEDDIFRVDIGENRITGDAAMFGGDYDMFGIVVASGMEIASVRFEVWNWSLGLSYVEPAIHVGFPQDGRVVNLDYLITSPGDPVDFADGLPVGAGNYTFMTAGGAGREPHPNPYSYRWSIDVVRAQGVPDGGATLALLGMALGGLIAARRCQG